MTHADSDRIFRLSHDLALEFAGSRPGAMVRLGDQRHRRSGRAASGGRPESTLSGHTGPQPWTSRLGGERAYRGRLEKDRSPRDRRHSM